MSSAWEQRPDESAPAFEAFARYRDLGAERSSAKVAQQLGKTKALTDRWSRRHDWPARAAAWDREQDRAWRAEQSHARRESARRHARMAAAFQSTVVARLQQIDPRELSPADLIRWFDTAVRIERQAFDMDGPEARDTGPAEARSMLRDLITGIRALAGEDDDRG